MWWFPCAVDTPGANKGTIDDFPDDQVQCKDVSQDHFLLALSKTKSTVSKQELKVYEDWTKEFGESGAGTGDDADNGVDEGKDAILLPPPSNPTAPAVPLPNIAAFGGMVDGSLLSAGVVAFLQQHDATMQAQLTLQQEIVLRLKQQQRAMVQWQARLEKWERDLAAREMRGAAGTGTEMQLGSSSLVSFQPEELKTSSSSSSSDASAGAAMGRERAGSIVQAMDAQGSGYVLWEQFLAYVRWQERHFLTRAVSAPLDKVEEDLMLTTPHRRASTHSRAQTARKQVRTRIELRRVFDDLAGRTGSYRVSCRELVHAIQFTPRARELFLPSLLAKSLPAVVVEDQSLSEGQKRSLMRRWY